MFIWYQLVDNLGGNVPFALSWAHVGNAHLQHDICPLNPEASRAALLTFGPITIMTTNNRHGLEIFCTTNDPGMLIRSCADCGNYTTWYCDKCTAKDRYPNEEWVDGQATPFCKPCEEKNPKQPYCHFCRKRMWVTPPPPPVKPSIK